MISQLNSEYMGATTKSTSDFGKRTRKRLSKKEAKAFAVSLCDRSYSTAMVGGKSSSLSEMLTELRNSSVPVPIAFSTTVHGYKTFIAENDLKNKIENEIKELDVENTDDLSRAGNTIRSLFKKSQFSTAFISEVRQELSVLISAGVKSVAVRSSATAEDLSDASFAGQQETLLNVSMDLKSVLDAIKHVYASGYEDRAIHYRKSNGYDKVNFSMCVCVQKLIRSDLATAGVMFTQDSESGHPGVVSINAVLGLGEQAVGGSDTSRFILGKQAYENGPIPILYRNIGHQSHKMVLTRKSQLTEFNGKKCHLVPTTHKEMSKFCLSDTELRELVRLASCIEKHFGRPMDIEWAIDGLDEKVYIVQARPITTNLNINKYIDAYSIDPKNKTEKITSGTAVGTGVVTGVVRILHNSTTEELLKVQPGEILVTHMTDPSFGPLFDGKVVGIITASGSPTCHAAIIAREKNIPTLTSCRNAMSLLKDGDIITISCCEGEIGYVYQGEVLYKKRRIIVKSLPDLPVSLKMNVGNPSMALRVALFPNKGVGLARQEVIITNSVGIHPQACLDFKKLPRGLQEQISARIKGYKNPRDYYVCKLAEGIALIARSFWGQDVILRLSDLKTNELAGLIGGTLYEPIEANPMIGYRGAARYLNNSFKRCFEMECEAIRIVREEMGLTNVQIMVPFVRTPQEGQKVIDLLAKNGLVRSKGIGGLSIGMMCEVPSNVILALQFAKIFDFGSIGSNDLTQLILGIDRDSALLRGDERELAVLQSIKMIITAWREVGKPIGICGEAPSQHKGFAEKLVDMGITSMSLNPLAIDGVAKRLVKHLKAGMLPGL